MHHQQQRAGFNSLLDQKNQLDSPTEDLQSQMAGMGTKMGGIKRVSGYSIDKHAAQSADGSYTPRRSASGESTGLSFAHKDDDYAQGQAAWAATSKYLKNGPRKSEPNPFQGKHASFADGFLARCSDMGLTQRQIKAAIDKAGEEYGQPLKKELMEGFEKMASGATVVAGAAPGMFRGILNTAKSWVPNFLRGGAGLWGSAPSVASATAHEVAPAANIINRVTRSPANLYAREIIHTTSPGGGASPSWADRRAALAMARGDLPGQVPYVTGANVHLANPATPLLASAGTRPTQIAAAANLAPSQAYNPRSWGGVASHVGQTALGAAGGALEGENMPESRWTDNPHFWGAVHGGLAFNPYLRRMAASRGSRSLLNPVIQSGRGAIFGGLGGGTVDQLANFSGLEGTHFGRLGSTLGFGFGGAYGAGRAMRNMAAPGSAMQQRGRDLMQGAGGGLDAAVGPLNFLRPHLPGWASNLVGINQSSQLVGSGRFGRTGRNLAYGIGGLLGFREGMEGFNNRMRRTGADMMEQHVPQIADYADDRLHQTLDRYGLLNQRGQVDPVQSVINHFRGGQQGDGQGGGQPGMPGGGMMQHVDNLLRLTGMDPSRMTPMQKMMMAGGAGTAGFGAMAGNPLLAGGGSLALMGGLLPALMPGQGTGVAQGGMPGYGRASQEPQQGPNQLPPTSPVARNEYQHQLQMQQRR
jgi:hypothetical protein